MCTSLLPRYWTWSFVGREFIFIIYYISNDELPIFPSKRKTSSYTTVNHSISSDQIMLTLLSLYNVADLLIITVNASWWENWQILEYLPAILTFRFFFGGVGWGQGCF